MHSNISTLVSVVALSLIGLAVNLNIYESHNNYIINVFCSWCKL